MLLVVMPYSMRCNYSDENGHALLLHSNTNMGNNTVIWLSSDFMLAAVLNFCLNSRSTSGPLGLLFLNVVYADQLDMYPTCSILLLVEHQRCIMYQSL